MALQSYWNVGFYIIFHRIAQSEKFICVYMYAFISIHAGSEKNNPAVLSEAPHNTFCRQIVLHKYVQC